jgi:hypothetical protein
VRRRACPDAQMRIDCGEVIFQLYNALMGSTASLSVHNPLRDSKSAAAAQSDLFSSETRAPARQGR